MATTRDELREDLVAVIEAAPELPKENRQHLADVFLDRLTDEYDLVPRGSGMKTQTAKPASGGWRTSPWVKVALVLAFLIFVVPAAFHHFPIVLLIVVAVFFAVRRTRSRRPSTGMSG